MGCSFRRTVTALLACAAVLSAGRATANEPYLDKIWTTPDYTQTDMAYGGFPDEQGQQYGSVFCGPVSASNSLMWLADHGWPNLAPLTSDRKKDQHDVICTIASSTYMDAYNWDGVGPTQFVNGLSSYIHDCGYEYSRFEWQGWRTVPPQFRTGVVVPDLDWMRAGIEGRNTIQLWNVGWYDYDAASGTYTRNGGHWVTVVGHSYDGSAYDPDYFIIHDPSPRCGYSLHNEYVLVTPLESGWRGSTDISGYYLLSGWPINPLGDCALLDGVLVVELPLTLIWDGSDAEWGDSHWSPGSACPEGGEHMVVPSGLVRVENHYTGDLAAAALRINGGAIEVAADGLLEVLGSARVSEGTLALSGGALLADQVIIEPHGVLLGSGTIIAPTVTIGGVLSPGGSFGFGALAIDGNPALGADSTLGNSSTSAAVPEPGSCAMLLAGLLGLAAWRRRRKR